MQLRLMEREETLVRKEWRMGEQNNPILTRNHWSQSTRATFSLV